MKTAKRVYKQWPRDAERLNRRATNYGGRALVAETLWAAFLSSQAVVRVPADSETGSWARILAEGFIPIARIGWTWIYRDATIFGEYEVYDLRHALAWLLLAKLLPFKVPPAFAARIREDFDCDLPWLCLADWLEEEGEPEHAAHLRAAVGRSAGA